MNVSIFRRLVSKRFGFLTLGITLSLAGKSMACPIGMGPIIDNDPNSTVCAQDTTTSLTYCTNKTQSDGTYFITGSESPPSTGNGCLPSSGTFFVYDVNCPANGKTVTHFVNGGGPISPPADVSCSVSPQSCVVPPNTTMVAWYPFDESAGPTAADLAAGNTGTYFGSPTPIAGEVAGALNFNGSSNYVEAPSSIAINFGPANTPTSCSLPLGGAYSSCLGDFSIDVWVSIPANASQDVMVIVDKRSESPSLQGYSFFVFRGRLGLQLASGGSFQNYFSNSADPTIPYNGSWHHIAVTIDRRVTTFGIIQWYLDGNLLPHSSSTTILGSLVNNSPLRIGTRTASPPLTGWFKGAIDELEIFNRVLTATEVKGIYNAGPLGKCKSTPPPPPCGGNPSTC